MEVFFEEAIETMVMWKHETETRLKCLGYDLQLHAKTFCTQLFHGRRDRADLEKGKERLTVYIRNQAQELVKHLTRMK